MRYIKFMWNSPFCEMVLKEYIAFDDSYTDEDLDQHATELDYSIYQEDYDIDEEACCECTGVWEEVSYEEFLENDGTYN